MESFAKKKSPAKFRENNSPGKKRNLREILLCLRPWSFSMTLVSVSVGSLLGLVLMGSFNVPLALLVLTGMIAVHGASNIINDYMDTVYGVDKPGAPTTLYRIHPLLHNVLSSRELISMTLVLYSIGILIGLYLIILRGWPVAVRAILGIFAGLEYTAEPLKYKYHGLGELFVFLIWGPLMTLGAYYVQTGGWQGYQTVLVISVPLGIWVAIVLLANNLKDMSYDYEMRIATVSIWLGRKKAFNLFAGMACSIYILSGIGILVGLLSGWFVLVFLSLPLALRLLRFFAARPQFLPDADVGMHQVL